ncbi:hypothetical protein M408DRAFT_127552 [Serendipita vermifera MAFF 305830]|uniref:Uncharacterized protein n=1 Tax=Serendipita vermifera MAFF 305830 TaxID=933852 RepID=A0A0C3BCA2_SERVB|nr:hypothetical protein M408DRAFT_127552 [Serendipita vermifera MAFF 305830]
MSVPYATLPTAIIPEEQIQYAAALTAEPLDAAEPAPPHTRPSESTVVEPDRGYVPRGHHREADENGVWRIVKDPIQGRIAQDIYEDHGTFMEASATVQIVTFYKTEERQAEWANRLKLPKNSDKLAATLKQKGDPNKTWRWIHCEGLHGPTMKTIAKETGWPLDKFAGIFAWTRPSSEWANGCLRVHFLDQLTPIWMLFREDESNPVFITCTKLDPNPKLRTRWEDFVDFGDSRPNLLLRKDPSLMLYAMMRAIIQDLRFTASQKHKDMTAAYNLAMSKPSQKSLQYFYELQQSLIRIKLDTTSLRDAATNLIIFVDSMHTHRKEKKPLVSEDTRYMLKDQIGLITLLFNELPEVTRQADAVANLAFNVSSH